MSEKPKVPNSETSDSGDEKPNSSRAPPPSTRAPSTVVGSSRFPGGATQSSRAPPPGTMLQGRDSPRTPPPASRPPPPGTMLQGRDSPRAPPATMLQGRDSSQTAPPPSRARATMLESRDTPAPPPIATPATMLHVRDTPSEQPMLKPEIFASVAPASVMKSIFITPEDLERALKQTRIEELDDDDREKQENWAMEKIAEMAFCPQKNAFKRVPYQGYVCEGGGHGITDHLLAEGLGGLLACKPRDDEKHYWEDMDGPYYPSPHGKGFIRGELPKK